MRKTVWVVVLLIAGFLVWYLLIKPYDYLITFKVKTIPGTINQSVKLWSETLDGSQITSAGDLYRLNQNITFNDSLFHLIWEIVPLTDSTSKVKVYIKDEDHSLQNKLEIPFMSNDFKKRSLNTVHGFAKDLQENIKSFKVTVNGTEKLNPSFCVYVPVKTSQFGKARGMMQNYALLMDFVAGHNLTPDGQPFVEITDWNMKTDSIDFNFCFPIVKQDSLPESKILQYKQFDGFEQALKATYNGNYITSDRAWYRLMDYAGARGIEISKTPVEVFYNNPNMGGDDLQWKAEIYMPIK
ncbi:MAG: AraC family transcriptional regulator [Flavobacteriaceae bacterium]|nr:AraC family transcriptional regulator [Flavobacteriaceae bacterium]